MPTAAQPSRTGSPSESHSALELTLLTSGSAREMKSGLESKWGIEKLVQARGYRRAAANALSFIKVIRYIA